MSMFGAVDCDRPRRKCGQVLPVDGPLTGDRPTGLPVLVCRCRSSLTSAPPTCATSEVSTQVPVSSSCTARAARPVPTSPPSLEGLADQYAGPLQVARVSWIRPRRSLRPSGRPSPTGGGLIAGQPVPMFQGRCPRSSCTPSSTSCTGGRRQQVSSRHHRRRRRSRCRHCEASPRRPRSSGPPAGHRGRRLRRHEEVYTHAIAENPGGGELQGGPAARCASHGPAGRPGPPRAHHSRRHRAGWPRPWPADAALA